MGKRRAASGRRERIAAARPGDRGGATPAMAVSARAAPTAAAAGSASAVEAIPGAPEPAGDGPPAPHAPHLPERIAAEARRWLAEPLAAGLHVVATPIGNLGDASPRALATLARADLVACEDTRVTRTLLAHFGLAPRLAAYHEHNAEAERPRLLGLLAEGRAVALVSDAGTPLISDPGLKLVQGALAQGSLVHQVPGPSAVLAALAVAGLATDTFLFAGFLPAKEGARRARLETLAAVPATLVLFEAPGRLAATLDDVGSVLAGRCIAVARELTKRFEEVRRGTAAELAAWAREGVRGEIVIVVEPPPAPAGASDAEIEAALVEALATLSLRDAARAVAEATGAARSHVYEIGLALRGREP